MVSQDTRTGYFNALVSGYFKPAADGRMLYFPWGIFGKGYVVPSQQEYARLHSQLKMYQCVSLIMIVALAATQSFIACIILALVLVAGYSVWAVYRKRGFAPSDEKMSWGENMAMQAQLHGVRGLWVLEIIALVFVASGLLMLVIDPSQWLMALFSIGFFGACAVVFARMLRMRRQNA